MGGEPFTVRKFAHDFRTELFKEHFGTNVLEDVRDPVSDEFWEQWNLRAHRNSELCWQIWRAEPSDTQTSLKQVKKERAEIEELGMEEQLNLWNDFQDKIVGHLVEYPTQFLMNENLKTGATDIETWIPKTNFV